MKRSEMVEILEKDISLIFGVERNTIGADWILKKLETLGMKPPERTYEDWTGMGTFTETDSTWEPE